MLKKRGVLREDEMRLPWLVLLLFPFFRCRILSPDLNLIRFLNWENSRHRRVFRFGSVLLPFPDCRFSDSVATMRHSFHVPTALRVRRFHISPCASMRICRYQPSAQYLRVSARDRMFFHGAFSAQTPNTALISPCQTSRSGIHSAVLYHDSF